MIENISKDDENYFFIKVSKFDKNDEKIIDEFISYFKDEVRYVIDYILDSGEFYNKIHFDENFYVTRDGNIKLDIENIEISVENDDTFYYHPTFSLSHEFLSRHKDHFDLTLDEINNLVIVGSKFMKQENMNKNKKLLEELNNMKFALKFSGKQENCEVFNDTISSLIREDYKNCCNWAVQQNILSLPRQYIEGGYMSSTIKFGSCKKYKYKYSSRSRK